MSSRGFPMLAIHLMDIRRTELGLMVVFETLMQERNVTHAAARLGLSQPATSAALRRLRDLAGDPLFLRTGRGLRPTARALALIGPVTDALATLRNSFRGPGQFDPATTTRTVTLMMSDIGETIYPARLIARLREEAPGLRVVIRRLTQSTLADELARGTVDIALGWAPSLPPGITRTPLFEEDFVCAVRHAHPRVRATLTLDQYRTEAHLLVARPGVGDDRTGRGLDAAVAARLAALGIERRVALYMPDFLPALMVIGATDLLLTLPRKLAETLSTAAGLRLLPLPFDGPLFTVNAFWHHRFDPDPASRWLRSVVVGLFGAP